MFMKILPVIQNTNGGNTSTPVFCAKSKSKAVSQITDGIIKDLSKAVQADGRAQKIKKQLENPEQRNVFFAAIASLITAAAAQITEIITGEELNSEKPDIIETRKVTRKKRNSDGDTYEAATAVPAETKIQLVKHKGRQADFEVNLINIINQLSRESTLTNEDRNKLTELYNKFCGLNYKGANYSETNELLSNGEITKNLIKELLHCHGAENLNNIISKYNNYTPEPKEEPVKLNDEILKIIQYNKNIINAYTAVAKDKENPDRQAVFENFIKSLNSVVLPKSVKTILFSRLNSEYSENLYELAQIYKEQVNNDSYAAEKFISRLSNRLIPRDAVKKWNTCGCKHTLTFFEYAEMIRNGVDDESVKEIARQKRNTRFRSIDIHSREDFMLTPPFSSIKKNFFLINNIFNILHKDSSRLTSYDGEKYSIDDIENEIKKHSDTYPNLKKHLSIKDKDYLNQGKMQNLLDLYEGNDVNSSLFTLHCYLRFIERVVIPAINKNSNIDEAAYCARINKTYIAKLREFKESLNECFEAPVEIRTYSIGDIEAPQFEVPMSNSNGEDLLITINNNGKIHTIF